MTAQIILLNQRGAAVASDTMLSYGAATGPSRRLDSSHKIFEVGDEHPVVVLSAGSAHMMGTAWDIALGAWARSLAAPLPTVAGYADDFCRWMAQDQTFFHDVAQSNLFDFMVRDLYLAVRRDLLEELQSSGLDEADWGSIDVVALTDRVVGHWIEILEGREDRDEWSSGDADAYITEHAEQVRDAFDYVFDDVPRTVTSDRLLLEVVPPLMVRKCEPWSVDATLAFTGFGAEQEMPAISVIRLTGTLSGRPLVSRWEPGIIDQQQRSWVATPAQCEAMGLFFRGYHPSVSELARTMLSEYAAPAPDDGAVVEAASGNSTDDDAHRDTASIGGDETSEPLAAFDSSLEDITGDTFLNPFHEALAAFSVLDSVNAAETLVRLEMLRAVTSGSRVTVGGCVESLVITRRHGIERISSMPHPTTT